MILDDLYNYYLRMSQGDDSVLPQRYWSVEKVVWEFVIDESGKLISVISLADQSSNDRYVEMVVPEHETRASGVKAFFLCDKASYFLGRDKKRGKQCIDACRELHEKVLSECDDLGALAVLRFFGDSEDSLAIADDTIEALDEGGLIVFRLLADSCYIHERLKVRESWNAYRETAVSKTQEMQCAVTGKMSSPAKLHPLIKGIPGSQSSGASLIGFNQESFCSYGKRSRDQGRNASISEDVAFGVGTALGYLVSENKHHLRIGNDTVVFWTDRKTTADEDDLFNLIMDMDGMRREFKEDIAKLDEIEAGLMGIKAGKSTLGVNYGTRYYVLGLSPNAARLSVRFYETWTLGELEKNFKRYLQDIEIVGEKPRSIRSYLKQTAAFGKTSDVPSTLIASTTDAMLSARAFPYALYTALLSRMRADHASRNPWDLGQRASMMKACLLRQARQRGDEELERSITVSLNNENKNSGYLLGRLFALLEKVQQEAIPNANTTIRDRYIGSASATPARVFPQLMKMSQHHISKSDWGGLEDRRIQEVLSNIDSLEGFPKTLNYDDQGQFFIGYYQQKEALYSGKKKEKNIAAGNSGSQD